MSTNNVKSSVGGEQMKQSIVGHIKVEEGRGRGGGGEGGGALQARREQVVSHLSRCLQGRSPLLCGCQRQLWRRGGRGQAERRLAGQP